MKIYVKLFMKMFDITYEESDFIRVQIKEVSNTLRDFTTSAH